MTSALRPFVHQSFSPLRIQPLPSGGGDGARLHLGGIGADARLGQRERGDRALGEARQVLLLLLRRAEELQRLRHADRLVRGEPGHARRAPGGDEADGAVVVRRAEPEAAVLLRDLHAPGAELVEALEELVVVLALPVDLVGVDVLGEEALELRQELVRLGLVRRRLLGEGMDQIEIELAEEEITDERGLFPFRLARGLGDFHRLDGALSLDFRHDATP